MSKPKAADSTSIKADKPKKTNHQVIIPKQESVAVRIKRIKLTHVSESEPKDGTPVEKKGLLDICIPAFKSRGVTDIVISDIEIRTVDIK